MKEERRITMMKLVLHSSIPAELKEAWNELLAESATHVPFLRYEYLETWWETKGGGEWPDASLVIVTAHEGDRLVGIAPLFQTDRHPDGPALLNLGSIEISDYLDVIARPGDLEPFLKLLLPFLVEQNLSTWDSLYFYNLLEDSPTLPALEKAAETAGWGFDSERLQHSPYIPLPGDWEQYLGGIDKKQRHEIRRKMRRAEEADVPVAWYVVEDAAVLDDEIDAFLILMEFDEEKAKFLTPPMRDQMRRTIQCAFEAGCLQMAFFTVNGAKAAAYLSFDYLNRIWVYNSGINNEFREYSPGWVLLGHLLKWANDNGRAEFDFMRGNEDYKYRFGAIDRFVVRASLKKGKSAD
jgi:CelD/BcsL family acetyltransferase involved in cellulose biosynthesis